MHGFIRISYEREQSNEYHIPGYSFAHPCFSRQNLELRQYVKMKTDLINDSNSLKSSNTYSGADTCRYQAEIAYLDSIISYHSRIASIFENSLLSNIYTPNEYLEYYNDDQIGSFTEYSDISDNHKDYTDNTPYLADMASEAFDFSETDNFSDSFFQSNQDNIDMTSQLNNDSNNTQAINGAEQYMLYSHNAPRLYSNGFEDDNYVSSLIYADDIFYFDDNGFEDDAYISPELRPMTPSSQY
jgi:hypothetical protein